MLLIDKNTAKDEEVLAASIKNPSFFGVLVDKYQAPFLRTAFKVVNHKEEAEDIVQEAFTKIYLNAHKFEVREGASFKSWAYKILLNTSFVHYKKVKRIRENVEYFDASLYENILSDGELSGVELRVEMKMEVSKVINEMPPHFQEILKKYYLEDKSQKDIASEENVSVATIKMRLFRAKKAFKKISNNQKILCST